MAKNKWTVVDGVEYRYDLYSVARSASSQSHVPRFWHVRRCAQCSRLARGYHFFALLFLTMTKIIDLLQESDPSRPHVSLEFFPPRTEDGVKVRRGGE